MSATKFLVWEAKDSTAAKFSRILQPELHFHSQDIIVECSSTFKVDLTYNPHSVTHKFDITIKRHSDTYHFTASFCLQS